MTLNLPLACMPVDLSADAASVGLLGGSPC